MKSLAAAMRAGYSVNNWTDYPETPAGLTDAWRCYYSTRSAEVHSSRATMRTWYGRSDWGYTSIAPTNLTDSGLVSLSTRRARIHRSSPAVAANNCHHPISPILFRFGRRQRPWYIWRPVSSRERCIGPAHVRASTKSSLKVLNRRPNFSEFF